MRRAGVCLGVVMAFLVVGPALATAEETSRTQSVAGFFLTDGLLGNGPTVSAGGCGVNPPTYQLTTANPNASTSKTLSLPPGLVGCWIAFDSTAPGTMTLKGGATVQLFMRCQGPAVFLTPPQWELRKNSAIVAQSTAATTDPRPCLSGTEQAYRANVTLPRTDLTVEDHVTLTLTFPAVQVGDPAPTALALLFGSAQHRAGVVLAEPAQAVLPPKATRGQDDGSVPAAGEEPTVGVKTAIWAGAGALAAAGAGAGALALSAKRRATAGVPWRQAMRTIRRNRWAEPVV